MLQGQRIDTIKEAPLLESLEHLSRAYAQGDYCTMRKVSTKRPRLQLLKSRLHTLPEKRLASAPER